MFEEIKKQIKQQLADGQLQKTILSDGSGVLLDIDGRRVFSFNATGMLLFDAMQSNEPTDKEDLINLLVDTFDIPRETAASDTEAFLQSLQQGWEQTRPVNDD